MEKKEEEIEQLKMDCEHFRARLETAQADCAREKKVDLLSEYWYLYAWVLITKPVSIFHVLVTKYILSLKNNLEFLFMYSGGK